MPDLTIEIMEMCASLEYPQSGDIGGYQQVIDRRTDYWHCTCPAFKFRKNRDSLCKHLVELDAKSCHYHQQADGPPETEGVCPQCGGETVYIKVAV